MTLRSQPGARLYGPRDCSAHVRSRWSYNHTTAISPKHTRPFHLRMRLQRRRFASNAYPLAEAQALISRAARILSYSVSFLSYYIPFNKLRLNLSYYVVIGTSTSVLKKDRDVVGLTRSFIQQLVERITADFKA
jgi:hypothetical protein